MNQPARKSSKARIFVYVDEAIREKLEAVARERGVSMSALTRDAVIQYLMQTEYQSVMGVFLSAHQRLEGAVNWLESDALLNRELLQTMLREVLTLQYMQEGLPRDQARVRADVEYRKIVDQKKDTIKQEIRKRMEHQNAFPVGSRRLLSFLIPEDLHERLVRIAEEGGFRSVEEFVVVNLEYILGGAR